MSNQRQHERIEIALPVLLIHESTQIQATTRNVSPGGLLVEGGTTLPFGASIKVRLTLPGGEVELPATVRWIKDGAIGVQFGPLRAKETWALGQAVKDAHAHQKK